MMFVQRPLAVLALGAAVATAPAAAWAQAPASPIAVPPAPAPIVRSAPPPLVRVTKAPRKKPWATRAEVSYVATGGNAETTTAKIGGEAQYTSQEWSLLFRAAYLTNTTEPEDQNRRADALVRGARTVSDRLQLFGQLSYLKNTFAGIRDSVYPLGGVAYSVLQAKPHTLTTRIGLGYGQESRLRRASLGFATADAETTYRWEFSPTAELRQDAAFTSNLARSNDWRFANVTSVAASLNQLFSLKLSHSLNYLNEPVAGFERVDTVTAAALVATF